ncbi:MAG: hypothetical protein SGJ02_11405 [bacterium]|nr:hypothetical protein [bacterium]
MTVEVIIEKLQALSIKKVVVFDDEIEELNNVWSEDRNWESIFTTYINELEEALGVNETNVIRKLKTLEKRLDALSTIGKHLTTEQFSTLKFEAKTVAIVRLWIEKLKSFGLNVDTYIDFDDFKNGDEDYKIRLRKYDLILLDFNFAHKSGSNHSELISREISDLLDPLASTQANTPPILIRFSSLNPSEYSVDEKNKFVREIGFARGCYDFLRKDLINEENSFVANMVRIISSAEYGRPLYTLSHNVAKTISQTAATEVMRVLYRLDPESIRIISEQKLSAEGVSTSEYFTKLFLGLLNHAIAGSKDVVRATKNLLDSIAIKSESVSAFEHEGLDIVQNNLLFDYSINEFQKPINFGDIFLFTEGKKDKVGILITQACDMAVRGQKSKPNFPKVEHISLLTGTLVSLSLVPEKSEKATLFTKFFGKSKLSDEKYHVAIKWNLQKTITLPRVIIDLASLDVEGKVTLPLQEAEIQSEWWSNAYKDYINWVCEYIRANHFYGPKADVLKQELLEPNQNNGEELIEPDQNNEEEILESEQKNGEETVRLVLSGTPFEGTEISAFGSAVVFSAIKSDTAIRFPIQRIARLQLAEALELQRAYHTYASRIGVMAEFSQMYVEAKVELLEKGKTPFKTIPAKHFKDYSAFIVNSYELEIACKSNETFSNLAEIVANGDSSLDLKKISVLPNFTKEFTFTFQGNTCQVRKKKNEESSITVKQKVSKKDTDPTSMQLPE